MQPESLPIRKKQSYQIFNEIASTYDSLNRTLSMGVDVYWRKKLAARLPSGHLDILDLATGTGDLCLAMAQARPLAQIKGLDLSEGMVKIGQQKVIQQGLAKRIDLGLGDGIEVPVEKESVDVITISFGIRNFSDPARSLQNCFKALRPGGKILILEFSYPKNPIIKAIYNFYFKNLLPRVGNWFSGHKDAYTYLNKTVENFPYGKSFLELMASAGLKNLTATPLTFGIAALYEGVKPPSLPEMATKNNQ